MDTNLSNKEIISYTLAIHNRIWLIFFLWLLIVKAPGQTIDKKRYERAKKEITALINNNQKANFNDVGYIFEQYIQQNPGDAEAWYFLGYAIDKYNSFNGEDIIYSTLSLATKSSECFQNCLELSGGKYQKDRILLDPHTKILSIWGGQAFKYMYQNKPDSAVWCLQEARARGGIDPTVLRFYSQMLDDVSDSAYFFNAGEIQAYYISYLQQVLKARNDINSISIDYLNTFWYPLHIAGQGKLPIPRLELEDIKPINWTAQTVYIQNSRYPEGDSLLSWRLKPSFENLLLRSDQILLKLLQQNAMEKDVFFPSGLLSNIRLNLGTNNYLQLRGLTAKLNSVKGSNAVDYLRQRLPSLSPLTGKDLSYLNNQDNLQPLNLLRFVHAWTAEYALAESDTSLAKTCFKLAEEKYPEKYLPFFDDKDKNWFRALEAKTDSL